MREKPRPQELYRHFKGNLYQIMTLATDSETRQELVVYQALYGDYRVYVRPLDMFMSEVDRDKYPDAAQKMRFEKVDLTGKTDTFVATDLSKESRAADKSVVTPNAVSDEKKANVVMPEKESKSVASKVKTGFKELIGYKRPENIETQKSVYMEKTIDQEAEELNLDPLVIQFMDADLASEKNDILSKLRPTITNEMIDIMALSLGVVVNEGDVYDRYNDLRTCLNTIEKFESTRLRS